tara:strand:- start:13486 stop:13761 length:276 start_codon:yes stop_codon:yes gene_type:complete
MKALNEFLNEERSEELKQSKLLVKKQRAFYKSLKKGDTVIYNSSPKRGFEKGKEYKVVSTTSDHDFQMSVLITNGKQEIRVSTTVGLLPLN